jgi:hypothetical protein
MSKPHAVISIALLAVTAVGTWAIFFVENGRRNLEVRQMEAQRQAALDNEGFSAWRHATRYDTFGTWLERSDHEPKRSTTYTDRTVWVKAFSKRDIKSAGKSQKYGNAVYLVTSTIAINDRSSKGLSDFLLRAKAPINEIQAAAQGEWHPLTMHCRVERLDGGDWIASEFEFSLVASKPDFPFECVRGE